VGGGRAERPGPDPGITIWGNDVWLVDAKQDKVFRYAGAASLRTGSLNAAGSFTLNTANKDPQDLVTDGTNIWVVNGSSTDKVFRYSMAGVLRGSWTIDAANASPTGITLDPTGASQSLWIVDNGSDRVYEYVGARSRTSGSQNASAVFALAAGNTNPQGIADPPAASDRLMTPPVGQRDASFAYAAPPRDEGPIARPASEPARRSRTAAGGFTTAAWAAPAPRPSPAPADTPVRRPEGGVAWDEFDFAPIDVSGLIVRL
jgi:hypothetical protein